MNNQYTKAAIRAAFLSQLNSKPFDKISVVDIAKMAGVSRNTFYYWYDDIYALMDDLFFTEAEKIRQDSASFDSWADGFRHAVGFASENRKAIYHLYKSISRNKLESFLYEVTFNDVSKAVATMKKRVIRYSDEATDDFAGTHIRTKPLKPGYVYLHSGAVWSFVSFFLYRIVAQPLIFLFVKLTFLQRFENRGVLKPARSSGAFIYANHTNALLDAFVPNLVDWRRRGYIVVGPDAMRVLLPPVRTTVVISTIPKLIGRQ